MLIGRILSTFSARVITARGRVEFSYFLEVFLDFKNLIIRSMYNIIKVIIIYFPLDLMRFSADLYTLIFDTIFLPEKPQEN